MCIRTHLIVCRKRTLSLISSGILLRMCLRALAFSFRSWNSCSGRSIMNSAGEMNKTKQKNETHTHTQKKKRCLAHPQRLDDLQHLTEHLNIASKVRLYRKTTQACTCTDISTIRCMKMHLIVHACPWQIKYLESSFIWCILFDCM